MSKSIIDRAFEVLYSDKCPVGSYGYRKTSKEADVFTKGIGAEKVVAKNGDVVVLYNTPACSEEPAMFWALRALTSKGTSKISKMIRDGWKIAEMYETDAFKWNSKATSEKSYYVWFPGCEESGVITHAELVLMAKHVG